VPGSVVVDAGPLVAWLDAADAWHEWAKSQFARLRPPLTTCEPVLTEAAHLVARGGGDPLAVVSLVAKGMLVTRISVSDQAVQLERLMRRYRTLPMSLADACLVRMAEVIEEAVVMTFDSDFRIYRAHGRKVIRLLSPEGI
jgi:predicted nucleic acid-binding protein